MLSYQHAYHAGNFADVLKHIVLCAVVDYLKQKDKPFYFHDTHAGRGLYPFHLQEMKKIREYEQGIGKLWPLLCDEKRCPAELKPYASALQKFNPGNALKQYPGSGLFAQALMRPDDQLTLTELHPGEFASLKKNTEYLGNVRIQQADAWEVLRSSLPPLQKRGVILIDPSYELKNEYRQVIDAMAESLKRFATGVYLIWYPILENDPTYKKLIRGIEQLAPPSLLRIELSVAHPGSKSGLLGSGLLVINAPWQLDALMKTTLPLLHKELSLNGEGDHRVQWLAQK
jgi:23S rRNA (adenine2030-N6)-methyltransferase